MKVILLIVIFFTVSIARADECTPLVDAYLSELEAALALETGKRTEEKTENTNTIYRI